MQRDFTLVELMIVVAIISILAAIAIPNFAAMQLRAKRAELVTVVDGLNLALQSCVAAEAGTCDPAAPEPSRVPDKALEPWPPVSQIETMYGFSPDGSVRGVYGIVANVDDSTWGFRASPVYCPLAHVAPYPLCASGVADVDGAGERAHANADATHTPKLTDDAY